MAADGRIILGRGLRSLIASSSKYSSESTISEQEKIRANIINNRSLPKEIKDKYS